MSKHLLSTICNGKSNVMLYVKTEKGVIEMTELLIEEFSKIGLHLNASKTKILTTDVVDYEFLEI